MGDFLRNMTFPELQPSHIASTIGHGDINLFAAVRGNTAIAFAKVRHHAGQASAGATVVGCMLNALESSF